MASNSISPQPVAHGYGDLAREIRALGLLDRRPWFYAGVFAVLTLAAGLVVASPPSSASWDTTSATCRSPTARGRAAGWEWCAAT